MARAEVRRGRGCGALRRAPLVAALALPLALAGCGFSPLYGGHAGATSSWEQVDVAPPSDRLNQLVYNELLRNRPPSSSGGRPYVLRVSVTEDEATLLNSRLQRVRLKAGFALMERASGRVLLQGRTFGDASYETTRLHFADARAHEAAQRTAARLVAQDIRTRVQAFFARGMPASAMPVAQPKPSTAAR